MDAFGMLLRQAIAHTLADNLTLTEQAAGQAGIDASVQLCKRICTLALDPAIPDEKALACVRALCRQAQIFYREQGI